MTSKKVLLLLMLIKNIPLREVLFHQTDIFYLQMGLNRLSFFSFFSLVDTNHCPQRLPWGSQMTNRKVLPLLLLIKNLPLWKALFHQPNMFHLQIGLNRLSFFSFLFFCWYRPLDIKSYIATALPRCIANHGAVIIAVPSHESVRKKSEFNPFAPNAPFLYPLKTSKNPKVFWCFQGVEKGSIGSKWVKMVKLSVIIPSQKQPFAEVLRNRCS